MANVSGASLGGIYDRLHDASEYPPLTAKTFADWSMEAGDIVTIQRDGKSYTSPAMNNTTVWRKKQQVSVNSTGKEKHDTVAKMSQRKFRGGSASLRATQKAFEQIITSYNEMTAGLVLASSTAHLYVDNKYTQMTSGLYLTASTAKLYTDDRYRQMSSGLELSTSTAKLYVDNRYAQMTAGLELTSSTAKLYVDNKYAQMTAGLDLTSSTAKLYTDDKYRQMSSGLELSTSTAKLYVDNKYAQMTAGLDLTSSTAKLYVDNKYAQMQAGLDLTSSTAKLYVDNKYAQMTAGLDLTSSTAKLYTDNKYTQMSSGLALSTSSAKLYVDNKYTQMSSGLELSTSTAKLYVDNKYAQMSAGLDLSTSAAILYAGSATNAATIAARINESTGEAEIILSSDKVYIGDQKSTTVINGKLNTSNLSSEISNLDYVVTKSLSAQRFSLYDSPGEGTTSVNVASTALRTAALNLVDNTYYLHLYAIDGTECVSTRDNAMSFSRATTLSGEWGSGTLTVRASPQGNNMTFGIFDLTNQDISWSDRTATLTVYANVDGGETKYDTGKRLTVTAPIQTQTYGHSWSSGTCTVTGTPSGSTTKIGIYDLRSQDVSWSGRTGTISIYANKDDGENRSDTGKRLTVTAPIQSQTYGHSWSSGKCTVTGTPSGSTTTIGIYDLRSQDVSWNGRTGTISIYANKDGGENRSDTGKRLTVTAPIQSQTYGHSWSNGTCTVTGTPSGSTTTIGIYDLRSQDVSWNDDTHTLTAKLYANKNGDESRTDTGKRLTLNITDISLWQGNTRLSGSQSIWSSTDIKAWCKVNGTWVGGDTITFSHGGTQRTLYKGYNTDDSVYYGKLYKSDGTALTGDSYYWYGCSTNFGTTASVNVYQ